jgi:hypothetical protein
MGFITGLLIGLLVGAFVAVFILSLMIVSRRSGDDDNN